MTTDARPRLEKKPPPRLDLTRSEWKLVVTGALGLAWAIAWLALAKPIELGSGAVPITDAGAAPPGRTALRGSPVTPVDAPRLAAAAPARRPRAAPIRIRTRTS
jgi:hypothetical protein